MRELEMLRRDALMTAFFAIYSAHPDDKKAIERAGDVVKRVAPKMSAAQVEECRHLAEELADIEKFWEES